MFILDTKFEYDTKFVLHTNASTTIQGRFLLCTTYQLYRITNTSNELSSIIIRGAALTLVCRCILER